MLITLLYKQTTEVKGDEIILKFSSRRRHGYDSKTCCETIMLSQTVWFVMQNVFFLMHAQNHLRHFVFSHMTSLVFAAALDYNWSYFERVKTKH